MVNNFFSILIPNLGFKNELLKCINSALSQRTDDLFMYEIVICDQSDKATHKKIKSIVNCIDSKHQIELFNPIFKSLFLARHFLMKHSNGQYIVFLDSDDYIESDYLLTLYKELSDGTIDMAIVDLVLNDTNGDIIKKTTINKKDKKYLLDLFIYSNSVNSVCRKIFSRSKYSYNDYSFFEFTIGEDKIFSYPIVKRCKNIIYIPISKYHYVQNKSSMMNTMSFESFLEYLNNTIVDSDLENITSIGKCYFSKFILGAFLDSALYVYNEKKARLNFNAVFKIVYTKIRISKITIHCVAKIKMKILLFLILTKQKAFIYHVIWKKIIKNHYGKRK